MRDPAVELHAETTTLHVRIDEKHIVELHAETTKVFYNDALTFCPTPCREDYMSCTDRLSKCILAVHADASLIDMEYKEISTRFTRAYLFLYHEQNTWEW